MNKLSTKAKQHILESFDGREFNYEYCNFRDFSPWRPSTINVSKVGTLHDRDFPQ